MGREDVAADKQATDCDMVMETVKIRKIVSGPHADHIIAWTGCDASGTFLADWYEAGAIPEHWPTQAQMDRDSSSRLIVVTPDGKCKHYQGTTHPIALPVREPFRAWGSGRDFAMGAMAAGASAYEAVLIASQFCVTCGGGIDFFNVIPQAYSPNEVFDDREPNHVDMGSNFSNGTCWCNPTFDGLAGKWVHHFTFKKESKAILTHSAHA